VQFHNVYYSKSNTKDNSISLCVKYSKHTLTYDTICLNLYPSHISRTRSLISFIINVLLAATRFLNLLMKEYAHDFIRWSMSKQPWLILAWYRVTIFVHEKQFTYRSIYTFISWLMKQHQGDMWHIKNSHIPCFVKWKECRLLKAHWSVYLR
jgi:hypothetical protein